MPMPAQPAAPSVGTDTVTSVLLGSGVAGLHYDFCNWLPASISGRVVTTATQNCDADPESEAGRRSDDPTARR